MGVRKIFKYEVDVEAGEFTIDLPEGSTFLKVEEQKGKSVMWFVVDLSDTPVKQKFLVLGTGFSLPNVEIRYCGTWQTMSGALVWHLFYLPNPSTVRIIESKVQ